MPDEDVNVSVGDAHLADFDEVMHRMEAAGLKVRDAHANLGIVTGSIDAARVDRLERMPEVSAVERTRRIPGPPQDPERPQ